MIELFGIPNCDTCKKARRWLDKNKIDYKFVDVRETPLDPKALERWISSLSWETLLNRRSTTWRGLSDQDKSGLNQRKVKTLILANPTLMKRPVCIKGQEVWVGFNPKTYAKLVEHG